MKRYLLHIIGLAALLALLGGCSRSEAVPENDGADDILVDLSVTTRAIQQEEGKEAGDGKPESMHLWIYGSIDGQEEEAYTPLLYRHITENLFGTSDPFGNLTHAIKEVIEKGKQYNKMHFYILLNEESVTGMNEVDKNTTIAQLKALTFTDINSTKTDNALVMYGEQDLDINSSKTNYEVQIDVKRSMAKLELYFTRNNERSQLTIKSIQLSSPIAKGYLVKRDLSYDTSIYPETNSSVITTVSDGTINTYSIVDYGYFSKDEKNFKQLKLNNPYLKENPNGVDWKVENDTYPDGNSTKGYVITVSYTLDGESKEKSFYLPAIERNTLYKIYVRIREMYWEASVVPYGSYDLKPDFGL